MPKNSDQHQSRLFWACRRGMLELDLILSRFLSTGYDYLTQPERLLFTEFLAHEDTELFIWFFEETAEVPAEFVDLIKKIKLSPELV